MKRILAFIIICSAVLSVSGCAFTDKVKSTVAGFIHEKFETEEEPEAESAETPGAQETEPAQYDITNDFCAGVIDFDTWNPLVTQSETVKEAMELVYEPLFGVDASMLAYPVLASGFTVSADGRTIDISINTDVKWHDGKGLDAYDVEYTIRKIKEGVTNYTENLRDVTDYRAVSNGTVSVALARSVPDFASLLTFPIVQYQTSMAADPGYTPVGTGPFYFWGKTETDTYRLLANESYHGGRAALDAVSVKRVPDPVKLRSMFEASEIDVITSKLVDLTEYMPKGTVNSYDYISNKLTFLGFNFRNSLLWQANTREAIGRLIDKDDIVSSVVYSRGVPTDIAINPKSFWYYDTKQRFKSDDEGARALLQSAGWGLDDQGSISRSVNGNKEVLKLTLLANSDSVQKLNIAKRVKEDIEKSGIKVTLEEEPYDVYLKRINSRDFDMFIGETELAPNQDPFFLLGEGNYFAYKNDEATTIISQMGMTQDQTQKSLLFIQLGDMIRENAPFIPIFYSKESLLTSSKIKSGADPTVSGFYHNAAAWRVK